MKLVIATGLTTVFLAAPLGAYVVGAYTVANVVRNPAADSMSDRRCAAPMREPGLANLYRVDEFLYTGGQPTEDGCERLKELGVVTVVNLRLSTTPSSSPND